MRETGFWTFFIWSPFDCVSLICWMIETIRWLWVLSSNECGLFIQCFDYVDNTFTSQWSDRYKYGSSSLISWAMWPMVHPRNGSPNQQFGWLQKIVAYFFFFTDMFWFVFRTWMSLWQKSGTSADSFSVSLGGFALCCCMARLWEPCRWKSPISKIDWKHGIVSPGLVVCSTAHLFSIFFLYFEMGQGGNFTTLYVVI